MDALIALRRAVGQRVIAEPLAPAEDYGFFGPTLLAPGLEHRDLHPRRGQGEMGPDDSVRAVRCHRGQTRRPATVPHPMPTTTTTHWCNSTRARADMTETQIDEALEELGEGEKTWASLSLAARRGLLDEVRALTVRHAAEWVDAAVGIKQLRSVLAAGGRGMDVGPVLAGCRTGRIVGEPGQARIGPQPTSTAPSSDTPPVAGPR